MAGGVTGAVFGARIVTRVPDTALRAVFATVLTLAGTRMLLGATVVDLGHGTALLPVTMRQTVAVVIAVCVVVGLIVAAWAAAMGLGGGCLPSPRWCCCPNPTCTSRWTPHWW
jgi:hypothetical protein